MHRKDEKFPDNGFEVWGGYMRAKISKLEEQFTAKCNKEQKKKSNIFDGISIYVNGFTTPSADELKEIMASHGGIYHTYQTNDDFIIASNLPDTKVKNMSLDRVVKPEWITDSLNLNSLLDYKKYLLYRNSKTQPMLNFQIIQKDNVDSLGKFCNKQEINVDSQRISNIIPINTFTNVKTMKTSVVTSKTASDPNFITEFYSNSRLHHISQLGAHFKQYINELREKSNFIYPSREQLKKQCLNQLQNNAFQESFQNQKVIMHIDMDCFFVSVGIQDKPELIGKPVAVTHSKGGQPGLKRPGVDREVEFSMYKQKQAQKLQNPSSITHQVNNVSIINNTDNGYHGNNEFGSMSEIASCSYEARSKGIKNGMFMGTALKLCPNLETIPYNFEGYKEVAHILYDTISQYTLDIEAVSCDEMYVDCTELLLSINISAADFATILRNEIRSKTGCPCSAGFGGNRLQARLATKQAKPNGQFFLTNNLVAEFMFNIKLKDLPGVGRQTAQKLESLGHKTCGSLQSLTLLTLQKHLGNKTGLQLFDQCRGHDPNPLSFYTVRKSVSAEVNYGIRFDNINQCEEFLKQLSEEVHLRMNQFKVLGKCITLKLMVRAENAPVETAKFMGHGFCDIINKSITLQSATNDVMTITKAVTDICRKLNVDPREMRGIGIQITKLESLHSKEKKGSLNKFLTVLKTENAKLHQGQKEFFQQAHIENNKDIKQPITPKTEKINLSPQKKSPIIRLIKSPVGKKKGKSLKTKHSIPSSKNLMSKFLQGQAGQYALIKSESGPDHEFLMKVICKQEDSKNSQNSKPQSLLALPWQKVRELLRAWFKSGQTPKSCDVNFIAVYMQEMVMQRNIEKLSILIKFMKRRIHEIDHAVWYNVENHIIEQVQTAMLTVYEKKLFIAED